MGSSATVVAKHREHFKQLINRTINKQGPDCDLNFIDVSKVMDMSRLFARSRGTSMCLLLFLYFFDYLIEIRKKFAVLNQLELVVFCKGFLLCVLRRNGPCILKNVVLVKSEKFFQLLSPIVHAHDDMAFRLAFGKIQESC